jgi:hypothetical protein
MCCHRPTGIGLIVLGVFICVGSAICHFHGCGAHARHAQFEQHIAEVCVKAAAQVQK